MSKSIKPGRPGAAGREAAWRALAAGAAELAEAAVRLTPPDRIEEVRVEGHLELRHLDLSPVHHLAPLHDLVAPSTTA